jgi:hypothetical protein
VAACGKRSVVFQAAVRASWRPRLRQLSQALHGCAARLNARSRSIARVSRCHGWSAVGRAGRCGRSTAAAAQRAPGASPAPRSRSTASAALDMRSSRAPSLASHTSTVLRAGTWPLCRGPESTACRNARPNHSRGRVPRRVEGHRQSVDVGRECTVVAGAVRLQPRFVDALAPRANQDVQ